MGKQKTLDDMKERPIIFSAPMVRAILAGRKTVTRRLMKPRRPTPHSPYGERGDRLWVRETWARICVHEMPCEPQDEPSHLIEYRADTDARYPGGWPDSFDPNDVPGRWRPSIFMPRHASRITLEVVSVSAERLQEATEEEAVKEGIEMLPLAVQPVWMAPGKRPTFWSHARVAFAATWDAIYGERAPWESNPWVWRVEFRRIAQ